MQRRHFLVTVATLALGTSVRAQRAFTAAELANYRLTTATFTRFAHATRLIGAVIRKDPRYTADPLITTDIAVAGDAAQMAGLLQQRLELDPALDAALFAADISAREYTTFTIALLAARLAHGFVESGALRRVPPGVATDNVSFVAARAKEVGELVKLLNAG